MPLGGYRGAEVLLGTVLSSVSNLSAIAFIFLVTILCVHVFFVSQLFSQKFEWTNAIA